MCKTAELKAVKKMSEVSGKFKKAVAFFKDTHDAAVNGTPKMNSAKVQLKDWIFRQVDLFKRDPDAWLDAMEGTS